MSSTADAPPRQATKLQSGTRLRVTLALAILLMATGIAGAYAASLLQTALKPPTSEDMAQLVCTAYIHQNYDLLIQQIDTTPAPPATGPFDAAALRKQLRGADASEGTVRSCTYARLPNATASATSIQYAFSMHRSRLTATIGAVMTIVRQPDGTWKISRNSDFLGTQV